MLQKLLIIVSYGAFLLLLMPATLAGFISAAVLFALGAGLAIYKKANKAALFQERRYLCLGAAVAVAAYSGRVFYTQWVRSSSLQAVASALNIPVRIIVIIGAAVLAAMSVYFLYTALQLAAKKVPHWISVYILPKIHFIKSLAACIIVSCVTVMLSQVMIYAEPFSMGQTNFIWCALIVLAVILLVYCLLGRAVPSLFIGSGIFMLISTVNRYVYNFRGRLFELVDIFSAGTAMNVADNYSLLPVPQEIVKAWGIFAAMMVIVALIHFRPKLRLTIPDRCFLLVLCIIGSAAICQHTSQLETYRWRREGAITYGYILDFASKIKEGSAQKPDGYSTELIGELAQKYTAGGTSAETKPPHIIAIMDEAFSDLGVLGEFSTNTEVMPFVSSLSENAVAGSTLVSVYGGNTANSEYEFLTGNSFAWLSPNSVPYQQYIRSSTYSMVSYLKSYSNYKCVAMHPYYDTGWTRPEAYGHLGFDQCYFIDDFPQENLVRDYVSDQEMFEFVTKTFEENKENPLFIFGVTMQNHGGYGYHGENFTKHISLGENGDKYPDVEQYLSLVHETDKAVEYLISYFEAVEEDIVIVFFGDHQPKLEESFYEDVSGTPTDTLDKQQQRYKVPFFVWANYDIEEEYKDCTSLNYLSNSVYRVAGITPPPYNLFLEDMEEKIPAVNANGFYSIREGCYLPFGEADGEEAYWLNLYESLQYNNIFDKRHRSEEMFPVLE